MHDIVVKQLVTQTDILPTIVSENLEFSFLNKLAVHAKWTVPAFSAAVVASGEIDTENSSGFTASHGLVTGLKVQLTTSGTLPAPLALLTDYWVIRTDGDNLQLAADPAEAVAGEEIDLTTLGTGNQTITAAAITPVVAAATAITVATKTVLKTSHGLVSGLPVQVTSSTTLPTGYVAITTYYTVVINADEFLLSDTQAHALAATNIVDPIDQGVGDHTFTVQTITAVVLTSGAIDTLANSITKTAHGFVTGVAIKSATGTTTPPGIVVGTVYYVIRISADVFKLAETLADAIAGTALDITGIGVGNQTITAETTAGTLFMEACLTEPSLATTRWFAITTAETVSATGSKLWEFVDKCYHSVRVNGTQTAGQIIWDVLARAEV